jgi:cell division protein FtsI (penicillin-binding protein 3)
MNERMVHYRFLATGALLILSMAAMGFRLASLHLRATGVAGRSRILEADLQAVRGKIFDRNGSCNLLAMDVAARDVWVDPSRLKQEDVERLAAKLAPLLDMAEDALARRLIRPDSQFVYLKRFVHEPVATAIADLGLPGVHFHNTMVRSYPQGGSMGHVVGFVNHERQGSGGVEQTRDRYLRGAPGYLQSALDARRREIYGRRGRYIPAMTGANVVLTLDQNIQLVVEQALAETVAQYSAKAGLVIVQRVRTGEILAMANCPVFDPNEFAQTAPETRVNRAIAYNYEPGSTFKPMVVAAALNEGLFTPETVIDCENGEWRYLNRPLRDVHGYGLLTLSDVVRKSSNIGTAKVGIRLGDKLLYKYLRAFGFGERAGIDLPGEERGILHRTERWSRLDASRISIGQAVSVTPLQLLGAVCALANGGRRMRPHVVREIRDADGKLLFQTSPEALGRPVRPETALAVLRMMQDVTEEGGTGRRARLDGYEVAGKTGTAQKVVDGAYSRSAYVASFVGVLPAENPEIGILVVIDEPRPEYYGGVVAAPLFREIAGQTARYLDILPTRYRMALGRH